MTPRSIVVTSIGAALLASAPDARAADSVVALVDDGCAEDLDAAPWALYRIDVATGDRVLFSGRAQDCSLVASGPDFLGDVAAYLDIGSDGTIYVVANDAEGQSVFEVDPTTGDRTIVSGCLDRFCLSSIGSGPTPASTLDAAVEPTLPASLTSLVPWALPLLVGLLIGLGLRATRARPVAA